MVSLTKDFKEEELVRKIWGKYLQNELKFDKWGGLGKILAIREVMREEGLDTQSQSVSAIDYQKIANEVFPRTFYCVQPRNISPSFARAIVRYFDRLENTLSESGLTGIILYSTCVEETAEKFCISTDEAERIVKKGVP